MRPLYLKTIMFKFFHLAIILILSISVKLSAQDTLPKISVKSINNQIVVSWKNNYGAKIININIQRSSDSLKNFTTIGTVLNPLSRENGFVDRNAINSNMFYRVFVAFEAGSYLFSTSHKPVISDLPKPVNKSIQKQPTETVQTPMETIPKQAIDTIQKQVIDTPKYQLITLQKHLTAPPVKETAPVPVVEKDLIPPRKFPKVIIPSGFVPSKFIYTNKDNNLILNLPGADKVNFSIRFYDDNDKPIFVIKKIKEPFLIVEKVNFLHTGWFYYDLYDDDILLEKYKFYIGKDGRTGPPPPEAKKAKKIVQK
jgi:hypothetical protein